MLSSKYVLGIQLMVVVSVLRVTMLMSLRIEGGCFSREDSGPLCSRQDSLNMCVQF